MIRGLLRHLSQNGEWEIRIPFAISRVGTKLYPLSAAEEPDESKEQRYYHPDYQILRYAQNDNVGVLNDTEGMT